MTADFDWTPDRVAKLKKLWATGDSASEIGRKMGITKNAVVSKARRADLPMRRAPVEKLIKQDALFDPMRPRKAWVFPPFGPEGTCLYPIGAPGDEEFHFCAEPQHPGKPYCRDHCIASYGALMTPAEAERRRKIGMRLALGRQKARAAQRAA